MEEELIWSFQDGNLWPPVGFSGERPEEWSGRNIASVDEVARSLLRRSSGSR